ncbi:hypothetical protein ZIOFF_059525 [Zingiber officinale]|uniref:DUF4216 domain-containing protein n=1 Tax=Zingiber officinale TaxID=94328 RepID=A0A8J5FD90_ZINOF|nr:hypothetical protein ZIOFF_059525 [Zingiber officinale]
MSIYTGAEWYKNDSFILTSQAKSVYYLNDIKNGPMWKLVQAYASHNVWDYPNIEVENDVDKTATDAHVVQELNSQPLQLVVELPELENVSFYRDDIEPTEAEMVDLRLTQSESEEFTSTVDNVRQPKDINIMMQVLGSWSHYVKGLGPLPKLSVVGGSRATNISSKYDDDYEKFATMQKTIDEQNLTIREQHQKFEALLHQLQQVIPGFSFQFPPTCSSIRPPPPPPPPPSSTM